MVKIVGERMAQPLTEENINHTYGRVVQRRGTVKIVAACLQNGDLEGLHRNGTRWNGKWAGPWAGSMDYRGAGSPLSGLAMPS